LKILLLNQAFYPDVASTAQHASDLAASLVERGHAVTVVSSRRAYDNPREQYPRRQAWRGVQIRRISCFGFGKQAKWRRTADFGSYLVNCLLHLIALRRFDVVVAMTSPPLISWLAALFVCVKGGKFAFWVMDLNPDEALAAGWLRQNSWATKCLQAMLLYALRRADIVMSLDRFMARRIEEKGISEAKVLVLPPWSHDQAVQYDAAGRESFRATHGLAGKFVVMYSGNHSPCHPLATLLAAAQRMAREPEVVFCFVGGGSEFEKVKRFAKRYELSNLVTIPYQPLNRLAASLSSADLHVVVMGDPFVGIVHPCKVYNIRALGIPYLYIGPSASHITELNPSAAVRHGDVDAVVASIRRAAASPAPVLTPPSDAIQHSQRHLVLQLALKLESLGPAEQSKATTKTWQTETEY
jgi:colanic acid biosynthesis glycosyl transferase WcaI